MTDHWGIQTVYVVESKGDDSYNCIEGIFSTEEKAKAFRDWMQCAVTDEMCCVYEISSHIVDKMEKG